jgi:glycerol-3-phosphate cytidylyltransferase
VSHYRAVSYMKKVLTVGVFDLLHIGHIELFRRARALGDSLTVAVQESGSVKKYKPEAETVYSTEERMYMVKAIKYVDEVIPYTDVDLLAGAVDFDILAAGPDQRHEGFVKLFGWCRENGKEVVILPRTEGISSSELKERIKSL